MRKLTLKLAIILFAILFTITATIATFVFLINSGRMTSFIEQRFRTHTNLDIRIKDIHLDIFSRLQLKQINVRSLNDEKKFTFECNTLTIRYKLFNLFKRRIKSIRLSDAKIYIDTEKEKTSGFPSPHSDMLPPLNINNYYPEQLFVEEISANNTTLFVTADGCEFALTETNILAKEIQQARPFGMSLRGSLSITNTLNNLTVKNERAAFKANALEISVEVTLSPFNINGKLLSEKFQPLIPEKYRDWTFDGDISLNVMLDYDESHRMKVATRLTLSELNFASPDFDYFGEGINGDIKIHTAIDNKLDTISFDIRGAFEPFLIQLGEFTTDMRNRKTHFSVNSNYDRQKKQLTEMKSVLSWDNAGTVTAEGDILGLADTLHLNMNIEMKDLSNMALFETFVKDTIEYSNPVLFNSHVEGESSAHFSVKGSKNAIVIEGRINAEDLSLKYGNMTIEDTDIELPFSIEYPRSGIDIRKQDIPDSQYGTVQLNKFSYGPLEIKDIRINPILISNNFFMRGPVEIPVFGGTIDIRDISVENAINDDRKIRLEFQINNIDLKDMTTTYQLTPFEGTLSSSVVSFRQHGQTFYSNDEIRMKLFGGDIMIRDLEVNNFLDSMRGIGFSAEVNHLDLGQMSNTYREWGNITGIINGRIRDFRLVAAEPSGFEIEIKTETHPDIPQIVSTKFLKNFVPGVGKVLDKVGLTHYKYKVMGLHARLENDYIKLKGAVREGEKELFMKGAGLKKLEIVFPNADRRVPFKTFLGSFKGILGSDFEGAGVQFE